ncbi:DUF1304 domain-containing protein [Nocardioides sp. NPDC000445]|uniref:DUF1304 domain-containing protein n=1 Tax=Nocardioides sp. NPDC000445 TaxID=3154257 RepID=UPI00331EF7A2
MLEHPTRKRSVMVVAGLVLAALAALLHVYIFVMESLTWTSPKTQAVFGIGAEEAEATKEMAFNQGFYNLFLAIVTAVGIVLYPVCSAAVGAALVFAGAGSMAAAAAVLFISSPDKRGAALKQGVIPLLAVVALAISVALS